MKTAKRMGGICACVALFVMLSVVSTPATNMTTIVSIPEITEPPDTYATLPITIAHVEKYGACTISIIYDPTVVHVTDVSSGPDSTVLAWNADNTTGIVNISAWNIAGVSGDIILANVIFKAVGNAGSSTLLKLNVSKLENIFYKNIPYLVRDGNFNIKIDDVNSSTPTSTPTPTPTLSHSPSHSPPTSKNTPPAPALAPALASPALYPYPPSATPSPPLPPSPGETEETNANVTPASISGKLIPRGKIVQPGFEILFVCVALLIAYLLLYRKEGRK